MGGILSEASTARKAEATIIRISETGCRGGLRLHIRRTDRRALVRVQLLSDLHFEYDDDGGEAFARAVEVAGDVLVLAGDVLPLRSLEVVRRAFGWFCARFPQ